MIALAANRLSSMLFYLEIWMMSRQIKLSIVFIVVNQWNTAERHLKGEYGL